jgi:alpha-amylase/alpha-mannosidase (GH57 family)
MHQPYYKNLLTQEAGMPWVRLHGTKDYLDMVEILAKYPLIHQTFNLVPSLLEQIEDYTNRTLKDRFLELSFKPAKELTGQEKDFILKNFFSISKEGVISVHPRYYELYLKNLSGKDFTEQDYLDLQLWFNLAWIDPYFRAAPELKNIIEKARFFSEEDKRVVLDKQIEILENIIPVYKKFMASGQIEITTTPYYHPILPLLYNTNIAKEANPRTVLPKVKFAYPEDAKAQIEEAVKFHENKFGSSPSGMWPSEESVSEHILPLLIQAGLDWIVADEAILFKSLKKKKRDTKLLYQPHLLAREEGNLNIVFRDRNLSDIIGFVYYSWKAESAVADLMKHLENIALAFKGEDILVTIAMDGENAWEYYPNDGHDFLELLYQRLSESQVIKTTTISEYLKKFPPRSQIKRLAAGSWIYAEFGKWIGNPYKVRAWEVLAEARQELDDPELKIQGPQRELALKQIYIAEGSDWFWWYGEDHDDFDKLFRLHLSNFYTIIGKDIPDYLKRPLAAA